MNDDSHCIVSPALDSKIRKFNQKNFILLKFQGTEPSMLSYAALYFMQLQFAKIAPLDDRLSYKAFAKLATWLLLVV